MGLLDGMPTSLDDHKRGALATAGLFARFFQRHSDAPEFEAACRSMMEGLTPATMAGIDRQEIDALLALGGKYLQAGQLDQAKEWLGMAATLDPFEERASYMLGVACQMRGEYRDAARMYVKFLALDATNPQGYLRLGECLLANGEQDKARACFELADDLCGKGHGSAGARDHARHMLAAMPPQPE